MTARSPEIVTTQFKVTEPKVTYTNTPLQRARIFDTRIVDGVIDQSQSVSYENREYDGCTAERFISCGVERCERLCATMCTEIERRRGRIVHTRSVVM